MSELQFQPNTPQLYNIWNFARNNNEIFTRMRCGVRSLCFDMLIPSKRYFLVVMSLCGYTVTIK